ncbi:hypothetical protein A9P82_00880 [Arachidicoccus ginsenosidimutans]|uniref:DUF4198 domain-containing protein n=1 Tax=Arachidicoccus sp. BS20 TaxID=1850526 RepID=UPI0007F14C10|nr:DUF4198 domain-containing protein [Arachidicoccus sp. BS20]ANI87997.1 hypothetical protein A9P82_00880 [Arachidicoccus sp. BS20]
MKTTAVFKNLLLLTVLVCLFQGASAHYLWIELPSAGLKQNVAADIKIYFGQLDEGRRETKGQRLDEVKHVQLYVVCPDGKKEQLSLTEEDSFYLARFTPQQTGRYAFCAADTLENVADWRKYNIGIVRLGFFSTAFAAVGKISSDISTGNYNDLCFVEKTKGWNNQQPVYQLFFKGKVLKNTKVNISAENEWTRSIKTDANGKFSFVPLWTGHYVIDFIYTDKTLGTYQGKSFEAVRSRATIHYFKAEYKDKS